MGSRRTYVALRRRAAIALAVWGVAFSMLALVAAVPDRVDVHLTATPLAPTVGQTVRFNASVRSSHEDASHSRTSFRFTFGDGSGTDWQKAANTTHAYTAAGNYTATVTVKIGDDQRGSDSVTIKVSTPPPPVPDVRPVAGSLVPAHPTEGDAVNLTAILLNAGSASALTGTVRVTDLRPNGTTLSLGSVALSAPLAPLAVKSVRVGPFRAAGVGNHTLCIRVTGVTPMQTDTSHAFLNLTMPVAAAPPPVPAGPSIQLLAATVEPARATAGDPVNLSVVLWNAGTATATYATLDAYDVRPDHSAVFVGNVPLTAPLPPSGVVTVAFPPLTPSIIGNHTLRVVVANVTPTPLNPRVSVIEVELTVIGGSPPPPPDHGAPPLEFGPLAFALAGAALASVAAAALLIRRPRPSTSLEPPPAAPPDRSPPPIWPP